MAEGEPKITLSSIRFEDASRLDPASGFGESVFFRKAVATFEISTASTAEPFHAQLEVELEDRSETDAVILARAALHELSLSLAAATKDWAG